MDCSGVKCRCRSPTRAKSIIIIAFFFTIPTRRITPINAITEKSYPRAMRAKKAPTPAEGRAERISMGWMKLSYRIPTIGFKLLYGFVIVRIDRRDLVWINVTTNPTAEWIARQITEAFPWDGAPGYMIRDRDRIYGSLVTRRLRTMGIRDKPTAPASPWQNSFVERLIGSIRRECVDHVIVLGEAHLRRILKSYARYYNETRTHLALDKDAPLSRTVKRAGRILCRPVLGGLHHHYARA